MFEIEKLELYPIAPKNDKIALIDADTVAFATCSVCEYQYFDIDSGEDKWGINMDDALNHALEKVQQILDSTGCCDAELHFTSGMNFRYTVDPSYKANRTGMRRPEGLNELKALLLTEYEGTISTDWEADDIVAYKKKADNKIKQDEKEQLSKLGSHRVSFKSIKGSYPKALYKQWDNMLNRCYGMYTEQTSNYKDNNIRVYQPWIENFNTYAEWAINNGWFEGCSIDRIDYYGHYIPVNIQFVDTSINTIKQNMIDNPKNIIDYNELFSIREDRLKGLTWKQILGAKYSENLRSFYIKQLSNIEGYKTEVEYFCAKLGNGTKFKYNNKYYIVKNNKPEYYRNFIMAAIDKDILYSVPGRHFNYYSKLEAKNGPILPHFLEVDDYSALQYNYKQAIIGDSTDGIKGVPGLGKAKVEKLFKDGMSEKEMWETVVKAFKGAGLSIVDAMVTMQLVSVHQLVEKDGKVVLELFNPMLKFGEDNE